MKTHNRIARLLALVALLCCAALTLSSCSVLLSGGVVEVIGEMKTYEVEEVVNRVEIALDGADLEIRVGDKFEVESNHRYLDVYERAGQLIISEKTRVIPSYTGFAKVILYVPENVELDNFRIEAGAGKVLAEQISTKKLQMTLGAGSVEIDKLLVSESATVSGGAGMLAIYDGSIKGLQLEMGVGALGLAARLQGENLLTLGVGNANVILDGTAADYSIAYTQGLGTATLDGEEMVDGEIYGKGETDVYFVGGVGTLTVAFEES
ncbi:MAG: DUF4097 family beta strand repeat protein [Clostridia bacterium]|nr:DUF4097 family beta strand repeat protein [Clostridia bacterium]